MRVVLAMLTVVIGVVYVLVLPDTFVRHLPPETPLWDRIAGEDDTEHDEGAR